MKRNGRSGTGFLKNGEPEAVMMTIFCAAAAVSVTVAAVTGFAETFIPIIAMM